MDVDLASQFMKSEHPTPLPERFDVCRGSVWGKIYVRSRGTRGLSVATASKSRTGAFTDVE